MSDEDVAETGEGVMPGPIRPTSKAPTSFGGVGDVEFEEAPVIRAETTGDRDAEHGHDPPVAGRRHRFRVAQRASACRDAG